MKSCLSLSENEGIMTANVDRAPKIETFQNLDLGIKPSCVMQIVFRSGLAVGDPKIAEQPRVGAAALTSTILQDKMRTKHLSSRRFL